MSVLRRVRLFAECAHIDPTTGERKRLVRMILECRHMIYRYDDEACADSIEACEDCEKRVNPRNASKAALARWGL